MLHQHLLDRSSLLSSIAGHPTRPRHYVQPGRPNGTRRLRSVTPVTAKQEPDWDAEMSLFRKRTLSPNQMETLRRIEEEVDVGKVACPLQHN